MFFIGNDEFEIRESESKGRGIFLRSEFPFGSVLGEYVGTSIDSHEDEEYDNRLGGFYGFARNENETILADPSAIGVHLCNHSCTPNASMVPYKGHLLLTTLRRVFPGEELTVTYVFQASITSSPASLFSCNCGGLVCRGSMFVPDSFADKYWAEFDTPAQEGAFQTRSAPHGERRGPITSPPKSLPVPKFFPAFGSTCMPPVRMANESLSSDSLREEIRETGRVLFHEKLESFKLYGIVGELVYATVGT